MKRIKHTIIEVHFENVLSLISYAFYILSKLMAYSEVLQESALLQIPQLTHHGKEDKDKMLHCN